MILSRTATENALITKRLIKAMPIIDSDTTQYSEAINGNELRTLNRYPAAYDFVANIIDHARKTENPGKYIKDAGNYYAVWVTEKTWKAYFAHCGTFTSRANLERQVLTDITTGWIFGKGLDENGNRFIRRIPPFRFMERRVFEDGTVIQELLFSKAVFESLVTEECVKKGGDGYIEIPSAFYPRLTCADKGALTSYNPIYRLNIFGLYKNTHKQERIRVKRTDLIQAVVPEYLDSQGNLKRITASALQESLTRSAREAWTAIPSATLVIDLRLGNERGDSTLYFKNSY
jgi:hypothetical protein